jgi:hypothetical protein
MLSVISRRNFSATHARALRESRFRHHEAKVTSDRKDDLRVVRQQTVSQVDRFGQPLQDTFDAN